jgi:phosphotriesterase-related protein
MNTVRTVLGDIHASDLDITAMHEHLFCDERLCRRGDFPQSSLPMILQDVDVVVAELQHFTQAGGASVVECTLRGWGRDVAILAEISKRTGIHVIAASGFYVEDCHPAFVLGSSIEQLEEFLVAELTTGADGTNLRTGILKSAISRSTVEGPEEKCARAIARAQRRTGVAITTHTSAAVRFQIRGGNAGMMLLDLFESEAVDPARVIIGHCDENADIRQLTALGERGAYIQFDVIGKSHWLLDATRVELLVALVERGHDRRLLLGSDRCRLSELKVGGGPGYDHVLRNFIPRLRERGFDDVLLHRILVDNPCRALSLTAPA